MRLINFTAIVVVIFRISAVIGLNFTNEDENYGVTWMYFPGGDETSYKIKLEKPLNKIIWMESQDKVFFELYTRKKINLTDSVVRYSGNVKDEAQLKDFTKKINPHKPTKILIHGWRASTTTGFVVVLKDVYLFTQDVNVIVVNWESLSSTSFYIGAAYNTREVGRYTADLIDHLHTTIGLNASSVHIIGHSLGAHVAGFTGRSLKSGKLARITGLDPAAPGFVFDLMARLKPDDANFVDVIHTCAGFVGLPMAIGHVDFYPNSGFPSQPGCEGVTREVIEVCSHSRSFLFFIESIITHQGFFSYPCDSWAEYSSGSCRDKPILMGAYANHSARGVHYLVTNDSPPFAMGNVNV